MAVLFNSGSGARIATYLIACAVLVACLAMIMPRGVSANIGPYVVSGTVTDSAGRPISGADVVAVMKNGTTTVDSQSFKTGGDGVYSITLATDMWKPGFTVTSTATFNSAQVSSTITVTDDPFPTINLQFPFEIPQFGSVLGFVAAATLVGIVAVVFLAKKSK